jgi:serine protease Do
MGLCLLIAMGSGPAWAQSIDTVLRDRLTDASVYIETGVGMKSRDWTSFPQILRDRIGERPSGITSGSGFLIHPEGYLLTNAHVVQGFALRQYPDGRTEQLPPGADVVPFDPRHPDSPFTFEFTPTWIRVVTDSGTEEQESHTATVLSIDPALDIAVLKIPSQDGGWPFLDLDRSGEVRAGDSVIMSGFPGGIYTELAPFLGNGAEQLAGSYSPKPSVNAGLVTAIREYEGAVRYQLDIRANSGNSGGAITNRNGAVVAILYAQLTGLQSINYAIPIKYALPLLPARLRGGSVEDRAGGDPAATGSGDQSFDEFLESGRFSF